MSSPSISCWDNIIGLTRTDCACYSNIPAAESNSGLYLDELVQLRSIRDLVNCEENNDIWDKMNRSRENATRIFIADTNAEMLKYYKLKTQPFYGMIGRVKTTGNLTVTTGSWYGIRIFCADRVSGILKIKKIGTLFSATGTVTAYIYNNMGELLHTLTLNTTANTHNINDIADIELPLHDGYIDNLEYYIIYQADGTKSPKNNDVKCSCGRFRANFDTSKPYWFMTHSDRQYYWTYYAMVGGFAQSTITDLTDLPSATNNYMYGLTLECEFKCKIQETLCKDYFDFEANPLAVSTAIAIRYKAGELLINDILTTPNLNRNVLINRDHLLAVKEELISNYRQNINYIANNINIRTNDCFECRSVLEMATMGIFA